MSPVQFRAVGRHRRPSSSRLPRLAATAAMSGTLVLSGATTASAHDTIASSGAAHPTLRYDSSGDAVRAVQKQLGVRTTGWFGPLTREAVKQFQRSKGLDAHGVVGHRTWHALEASSVGKAPAASQAQSRAAQNRARPARASRGESRATLAERVLAEAARHEGKPYRYGATGPDSFDCSGFTGYVFRQVGINLPRSSRDQRAAVRRISADEARPGDLLFSHDSSGRVYHVAIYAGDGRIWDSPRSGETVGERKIWSHSNSFGRVG
jgi:cell wall-associated NlpC family hydrolase